MERLKGKIAIVTGGGSGIGRSIETPIYRKGRTREQIDQWLAAANGAPIGRIGDPQEIANTALFLASDESAFICGETIVADGGRNARMS